MKKHLLLFLLFFTFNSYSQTTKYHCLSVVEVENTESGDKYSESKKSDKTIFFDLTNRKIKTSDSKIFNIVKMRSFPNDESNEESHFNCINEKGEKLTVVLINYLHPKNGIDAQILIKKEVVLIYEAEKLEN
jgi:hypothetical protein